MDCALTFQNLKHITIKASLGVGKHTPLLYLLFTLDGQTVTKCRSTRVVHVATADLVACAYQGIFNGDI